MTSYIITLETRHTSWTDKKAAKTLSRLNPEVFLGLASQLEPLMANKETPKPATSDSKCPVSVMTARKRSSGKEGWRFLVFWSILLVLSTRKGNARLANAQDRRITSSVRYGDSVFSSSWSGFEMRMCSNSISVFDTFQRLALEEETNILTFLVIWINFQEYEPENRNNVVFFGNIEFHDVILLLEIKT